MAFCTVCGAQVTGAFCNQCGTPASGAAAGQAAPPPVRPQPAMQPMTPPASGPVPVQAGPRKTSPLVWVLVIVLGLFVLGGIAVAGFTFFVVHKVRQAGLDPDLIRRNPGLAVGKLITSVNPDVDVINTDENAGTITIRDRKTNKVVTLTFDQVKNGQFKMSATDENGKATMEIGGDAKLPSWVPNYPGSEAKGTFAVKGDAGDGSGEGGNFTFTTRDSASKVLEFYQDKAKELGMKVNVTSTTDQGGMIIASDEDSKRSLTIVVGGSSGDTTVNLTYGLKR